MIPVSPVSPFAPYSEKCGSQGPGVVLASRGLHNPGLGKQTRSKSSRDD